MVDDAEAHAAEDRQAREAVDARNRADQLVYQVEKTLRDAGSKLAEGDQVEARAALQAVRDVLGGGDAAAIGAAADRLETAAHKLAEAIYRSHEAPGAGPAGSSSPSGRTT